MGLSGANFIVAEIAIICYNCLVVTYQSDSRLEVYKLDRINNILYSFCYGRSSRKLHMQMVRQKET